MLCCRHNKEIECVVYFHVPDLISNYEKWINNLFKAEKYYWPKFSSHQIGFSCYIELVHYHHTRTADLPYDMEHRLCLCDTEPCQPVNGGNMGNPFSIYIELYCPAHDILGRIVRHKSILYSIPIGNVWRTEFSVDAAQQFYVENLCHIVFVHIIFHSIWM